MWSCTSVVCRMRGCESREFHRSTYCAESRTVSSNRTSASYNPYSDKYVSTNHILRVSSYSSHVSVTTTALVAVLCRRTTDGCIASREPAGADRRTTTPVLTKTSFTRSSFQFPFSSVGPFNSYLRFYRRCSVTLIHCASFTVELS